MIEWTKERHARLVALLYRVKTYGHKCTIDDEGDLEAALTEIERQAELVKELERQLDEAI